MKKILSILLSATLVLSLVACGAPPGVAENNDESLWTDEISGVSSEEEPDSEFVSEADDESEIKSSDEEAIPENASEYAVELYNRYVELSKDNGFEVSNVTHSGDWTKFSLIFGEYENQFMFYKENKSFSVYVNNKPSASEKKNVIAKILMGLNDISADEAKVLSQDIANSYSHDNFSDTIDIGQYFVVLTPKDFNYFTILNCRHQKDIWEEINKAEYPDIDFKMYESPELNIGEKCKVTGTIIDWNIKKLVADVYDAVAVIKTDDGKQYNCTYLYENTPIKLEVGKKYTIYGSIGRDLDYKGEISINYPEKID